MKKLVIHNPINLLGGNTITACFKGTMYNLKEGEEVQLVDPNAQELMYANVENIWQGSLCDAPAILLEMAHDPIQRTFSGLWMRMLATEGSTAIDMKITILAFKTKMSTIIRPS